MFAPATFAYTVMDYDVGTSIGMWTNQAGKSLYRNLFKLFKNEAMNITPEQWTVMTNLITKEGISQSELAAVLDRDNSSVTRIIDTMTKNDLVERKNHQSDRRVYCIVLTSKGKALQSKLIKLAIKNFEQALVDISEKDLQTTLKVLKKITQNLSL